MTSLDGTMTFELLLASQRAGVTIVAIFALLSTLAPVLIALRSIRLVFLQHDIQTSRPPEILCSTCTRLGHYGGCLILSNLFISASRLINFNWSSHSELSQGPTCSLQAVLMQIGIWGTCWFTAALGVHTLSSFMFHIRQVSCHSLVAVATGWTVAFVAGLTPLLRRNVYGPTGPSCGITRSYPNIIFVLEALPIILTAFVSTTTCSAIFIALSGRLSMSRVDRFEEHQGLIRAIMRAMFWFLLAFVFLLLPFCVTHILMGAGHLVPFALSIFADVCVSTSGFVNACLLRNIFQVICTIHRGSRADKVGTETTKTLGNDASGESLIDIRGTCLSPSTILSHESSHQVHNVTQRPLNHSRCSSWASADSIMEFLNTEGALYESVQREVAPLAPSGMTPPLRLGRKGVREPTLEPNAPPALNLPLFSGLPLQLSAWEVTNKSSMLATRLGISAASPCALSHPSIAFAAQKLERGNARISAFHVMPIPQIEVNMQSLENVEGSNSPPPLSPASLVCPDSDSDYSVISHVCKASQVSKPNSDERGVVDACPPSPRSMRARSQRTTMTSVWSQETGYTLSLLPNARAEEAHPQSTAHLLVPRVMRKDQVGVTSGRTLSGPRAVPKASHRTESPDSEYLTIAHATIE